MDEMMDGIPLRQWVVNQLANSATARRIMWDRINELEREIDRLKQDKHELERKINDVESDLERRIDSVSRGGPAW